MVVVEVFLSKFVVFYILIDLLEVEDVEILDFDEVF